MKTTLFFERNPETSPMSGVWKNLNPSKLDEVIGECGYRYLDVDRVVNQGQNSFVQLQSYSLADRKQILIRAAEALSKYKLEIQTLQSLELGRTLPDLDQEWLQMDRYLKGLLQADHHALLGEARGVAAVVGSYVWPVFYSIQFAFANFLAGNAPILKPAEKSTLTVHRLFELLRTNVSELSFIQVLVGDREIGRRLTCHEGVALVIFQGSFEVGMRVRQDTLAQPSKEVLLYLGSKNPAVVFDGAGPEALQLILEDAFMGTGQDCQSVSLVFVQESSFEAFLDAFHQASKAFKIGNPSDGAWMGPVTDGAMLDRYLKFVGISEREGAEIVMRGKPLPLKEKGHFATPTLAAFRSLTPDQMRKSVSLQTEILSPHVSLIGFKDGEALLQIFQKMSHGSFCSLFGPDRRALQSFAAHIPFSRIAIGASLRGMDPLMSAHAQKRGGNHGLLGLGLLSQLTRKKVIVEGKKEQKKTHRIAPVGPFKTESFRLSYQL